MTHRLTRIAYVVMLFVVALTLVINLPPLEELGRTPSSKIVTFSVDRWSTEIHRNLKKGRHAEMRADELRSRSTGDVDGYYRDALYYYNRAQDYAERSGSGSYIDDFIHEAKGRVHSKISRNSKKS